VHLVFISQQLWNVWTYSPGLCGLTAVDEKPARLQAELHRLPGEADNGGDVPITN